MISWLDWIEKTLVPHEEKERGDDDLLITDSSSAVEQLHFRLLLK